MTIFNKSRGYPITSQTVQRQIRTITAIIIINLPKVWIINLSDARTQIQIKM